MQTFRTITLAIALAASTQARSQSPDDPQFLLTRLELDLSVDYERGSIGGSATLHIRNVSERAALAVPLLLNRLMTVTRVVDATHPGAGFTQDVVIFGDAPALQVNSIIVTPASPVPPGDSLALTVHYGGILTGYTETGSLYIRDHVSRDFTIIREDAYAFPVLGVPSWRANRAAPREPFAFTAKVTVPTGLVVAMGGVGDEIARGDSLATWTFRSSAPVPFLNVAIAPYRTLEGEGSRIHYFAADSAGAVMVERGIAAALERLGGWYGPLGVAPNLVVMEIPEGFGSQASLTAGIIQTADAFRDRAELRQLYHELSHLWNVPDLDRPSPRWNEGLATFVQWRLAGELDGWNDWEARLDRTVQGIRRSCRSLAQCDSVPLVEFGRAGLGDLSYSVGFLAFYALYQAIGPAAFDQAYREFFQQYRVTGARTGDLIDAFRAASPRSERVTREWVLTTRWYERLASGETIREIVDSYRR